MRKTCFTVVFYLKVPFIFGIFQNPSSYIYKSPIDINIPNLIKIEPVVFAVARDTDIHTDRQTYRQTYRHFVKTTFLDSGDLKTDNSIEISNSNFFTITILSLYYSICEKVNKRCQVAGTNFLTYYIVYEKVLSSYAY